MFCPKCGKINSDESTQCTGCGATLHEELPVKEKKRFPVILTAIIVAVAIAVASFVVLSLTGCSGTNYEEEDIEIVQF